MTRKKKRKPPRPINTLGKIGQTHVNRMKVAIQKILLIYGLDTGFFDILSKRHHSLILRTITEVPRYKVAEKCHVPRHIVKYLSEATMTYLNRTMFKDPAVGLSCLDALTYGVSFGIALEAFMMEGVKLTFTPAQQRAIRKVHDVFRLETLLEECADLHTYLHVILMMVSKVNFRIYACDWVLPAEFSGKLFRSIIYLSSEDVKPLRFSYLGMKRHAYRVCSGKCTIVPAMESTIDMAEITGKETDAGTKLAIYIQPHALQRVKERIDIFPPPTRNLFAMKMLLKEPTIEFGPDGQPMIVCQNQENVNGPIFVFGFFPFVIKGGNLIILSFFTPTFSMCNEGARLCKEFGLRKEDMVYLGMDKLSFLYAIDFKQVPRLERAFSYTRMYKFITDDVMREFSGAKIDPARTAIVKKFFEGRK